MVNLPSSNWNCRDFLKSSAAAVLGLAFSSLPAMAELFTRKDFDHPSSCRQKAWNYLDCTAWNRGIEKISASSKVFDDKSTRGPGDFDLHLPEGKPLGRIERSAI